MNLTPANYTLIRDNEIANISFNVTSIIRSAYGRGAKNSSMLVNVTVDDYGAGVPGISDSIYVGTKEGDMFEWLNITYETASSTPIQNALKPSVIPQYIGSPFFVIPPANNSNMSLGVAASGSYSLNWTVNATGNISSSYVFWVNISDGNNIPLNFSRSINVTITAPTAAADSCTIFETGDSNGVINCADNCAINSAVNMANGIVTFTGAGHIYIDATISNVLKVQRGDSSTGRCTVTCRNGCFKWH